jgi:hypothetical protein
MKSILELDEIGAQVVAEQIGGAPRPFEALTDTDKDKAIHRDMPNPFFYWLKQVAEAKYQNLDSLDTPKGYFKKLLEVY